MSATGQKLNRSRKPKRHAPSQNRRKTGGGGRFKKGNQFGRKFQKGNNTNPGGRPKTAEFAKEVREWLAERDPRRKDHKARLETVLERLMRDNPHYLLYYAYGNPMDTVQLQGADVGAVTVKWFLDPEEVTGPAPEKLLAAKKDEA